jgi:hypothetical protein
MCDRKCEICGSTVWLERHHVFGGANRTLSERCGLVATLCHFCHNEPPNGIHHNHANNLKLKQKYQAIFEQSHTREEFLSAFGKNYLED